MKLQKRIKAAVAILALLSAGSALRAKSVRMHSVPVGNPGNAADSTRGSQYVELDYAYNIGKEDVTDSRYAPFFDDVDATGANSVDLYTAGGEWENSAAFNSGAANGQKFSIKTGYGSMPVVDVAGSGSNEPNYFIFGVGYSVAQDTSYDSSENSLSALGSFTGPVCYYGTDDQAGDVYYWTDMMYNP